MDPELKREIIMENYLHPLNKELPKTEHYTKKNTSNASCIDNLDIYFLVENNYIKDITFTGEACAISTASTSIMIKSLVGLSLEEASSKLNEFEHMIGEEKYDATLLEEACAFDEIYKQQNRKNCAYLPWRALKDLLNEQ